MPPPVPATRITIGTGALALAIAMAAAYGWTATRGAGDELSLVSWGALERGRVWDGQAWRLLTAPFLHASGGRVIGDALGVLLVGSLLEATLGTGWLVIAWVASAAGAGAATLLGADTVSTGSAGVVLGLTAALLVLHAAGDGPFARTLRPRLAWAAAALLADALAPAVLPAGAAWNDLLGPDRLALAGGFAAGAAVALVRLAPAPRWRAALPATALLAVALALALRPRPGPTRYDTLELGGRIYEALRGRDFMEANRLLDDAAQQGMKGESFGFYRALARAQEGRLEEALALLRPLDRPARPGVDDEFRADVRRHIASIAHMLGYRLYTGDGRPRDPYEGLLRFEEACAAGDREACTIAARIRGGPGAAP